MSCLTILNWCGQHPELLVAIAGFATSVAIAKITSGLDLRRTLCVRRFDTYEKAVGHLSLKLNVYYNILAALESLNDSDAVEVMKWKTAQLLLFFDRLGEIEKEDRALAGVAFYSRFPSYDVRPLIRESAHFLALLQDFSQRANLPNAEEHLRQFAPSFIDGVKRLVPLVAAEVNHLNSVYDQLSDEIRKDKSIKKLLKRS